MFKDLQKRVLKFKEQGYRCFTIGSVGTDRIGLKLHQKSF